MKSNCISYRIQDYFYDYGYPRAGDAALATFRFIGDCVPSMILILLLVFQIFFYSCASNPIMRARTAEQKWYAAVESFNLVQEAAIHYASDPHANPKAVEAMADLSDYGIKIIAIGETIVKAKSDGSLDGSGIDGILGIADQLAGISLRISEILANDLRDRKV